MKAFNLLILILTCPFVLHSQSVDPDNPLPILDGLVALTSSGTAQGYYYSYSSMVGQLKITGDGKGEQASYSVQLLDEDFNPLQVMEFQTSEPLVRKVFRYDIEKDQRYIIRIITPNAINTALKLRFETIKADKSGIDGSMENTPKQQSTINTDSIPSGNLSSYQNDSSQSHNEPSPALMDEGANALNISHRTITLKYKDGTEKTETYEQIRIISEKKDKLIIELKASVNNDFFSQELYGYEIHVLEDAFTTSDSTMSDISAHLDYGIEAQSRYFLNKKIDITTSDNRKIEGIYSSYTYTLNKAKSKHKISMKGKKIPKFDKAEVKSIFVEL
jgi:hypothetical protein